MSISRICRHAYTLGILLAVLIVAWTPVHSLGTRSASITRVLPNNRFEVDAAPALSVGRRIPVFRFSPEWRQEIGFGRIVEISGDKAIAEYEPRDFVWPLGLQGRISTVQGRVVEVDIGSEIGLEPTQILNVYDGIERRGRLRVRSVGPGRATALLVGGSVRPGQVVSPYILVNRISWFEGPLLIALEWGVLCAVFGGWAWSVMSPVPGRVLSQLVARLKNAWRRTGPRGALLLRLALGPLVVLVVGRLGWNVLTYLASMGLDLVRSAGIHHSLRLARFYPALLPYVYGALGAAYVGWLVLKRSSPVVALWQRLGKAPTWMNRLPLPTPVVFWALHLVVFYAFGNMLMDFVTGNLGVLASFGWPGAGLRFDTFAHAGRSLGYMSSHPILLGPATRVFTMLRYFVWTTTILGCLIGYLHAVVSIFFKPSIRSVDFTLTGWIINGICYGPLLGGVLHYSLPHAPELVPVVTDGPWVWLALATEFLLNVLYMFSVWNLGTMFGVMVDKGVRKTGFYSVVRHPSYTLEGLMFVMMFLPGLSSWQLWVSALAFPLKYWVRSERDDIFMGNSNEAYVAYRSEVPYKLFPGVY